MSKVSKLFKEALTSGLVSVPTKEEDSEHKLPDPPKTKAKKTSTQDATPWIQFNGMTLTHLEVESGSMLSTFSRNSFYLWGDGRKPSLKLAPLTTKI